MKLSADQFELILASLKSFGRIEGNDKRRSPRVGLRMTATLVACEPGQANAPASVWVRDLSASGIGLTHTRPLAAGSFFMVAFRRSSGEVLSVLYRVAHCQRLSDRAHAIGATLQRVIAAEDSHPPAAPAPARRTA